MHLRLTTLLAAALLAIGSAKTIDVSGSEWFTHSPPLPAPPSGHDASSEVEYGATLFTHGKVTASVAAFDQAMAWDGRINGTLWQRGCAMYYTEQWVEGAAQFALDVSENPNDTEESVWRWLCQARGHGVQYATAHRGHFNYVESTVPRQGSILTS